MTYTEMFDCLKARGFTLFAKRARACVAFDGK